MNTNKMNTTEARVKEIFTEHKFGEIKIVTEEVPHLRGISNSDVLPTFRLGDEMSLEVTIYQHEGEKISNRKGFGWVHTNYQCARAEKARKKLAEMQNKLSEIRANTNLQKAVVADPQNPHFKGIVEDTHDYQEEYKKAEKAVSRAQKKLCKNHNAQYGCSSPCKHALDMSKGGMVTKIQGNIFYRNGYGASTLDFVYFAIIKTNSEGVPMLYVRRRPASRDFISMSAQEYQKNYVAKNKHIKNSFCICVYKPPEPQTVERKPDLSSPIQTEVAGSQNLPAVIGQTMPVLVEG